MTILQQIGNWINQHTGPTQAFFQENPFAGYYIQGLVLSLVIYLFYLELNPGIGGIFMRPDSTGHTKFRLGGVVPILKYPFQSVEFWKPKNWDLNFLIFTGAGAGIYAGLKYYLNHIVKK